MTSEPKNIIHLPPGVSRPLSPKTAKMIGKCSNNGKAKKEDTSWMRPAEKKAAKALRLIPRNRRSVFLQHYAGPFLTRTEPTIPAVLVDESKFKEMPKLDKERGERAQAVLEQLYAHAEDPGACAALIFRAMECSEIVGILAALGDKPGEAISAIRHAAKSTPAIKPVANHLGAFLAKGATL